MNNCLINQKLIVSLLPVSTSSMIEVIVLFDGYSRQSELDSSMDANCTCTLIKGTKNIIVDTMTAWDRDRIVDALAQQNLKPSDIDYVVCTHSHADHIGNNNLFTNAEHIIGTTVHRGTIFYARRIEDQDYELCEGVKVMFTPGHTTEDVTVLVENKIGDKCTHYAITGDLFEKEEDILDPLIWKGLGADRKTQARMRLRVIKLVDFIIPGHGPMFRATEAMKKSLEHQIEREMNN